MSKFDTRYSEILNEAEGFMAGLGKAASYVNNAASAVGSGIKAANDPFGATKNIIQGLAGYKKQSEESQQQPISDKNKVKRNTPVWCNTTVYTYDSTKPTALEKWVAQEEQVEGIAQTDSDAFGNFKVKLLNPKYIFFNYTYNERGATRSIKEIGIIGTGIEKTPGAAVESAVGLKVNGIDQGLRSWYIKANK
jgi:hypothetical protein